MWRGSRVRLQGLGLLRSCRPRFKQKEQGVNFPGRELLHAETWTVTESATAMRPHAQVASDRAVPLKPSHIAERDCVVRPSLVLAQDAEGSRKMGLGLGFQGLGVTSVFKEGDEGGGYNGAERILRQT